MPSSPQQEIFPPKPKGKVVTPLTARAKLNPTDVTPLSPQQDIQDAIEARKVEASVQPEREDGDESRKAPKASRGNRLLGATKAER
jgi:hypothetical protein